MNRKKFEKTGHCECGGEIKSRKIDRFTKILYCDNFDGEHKPFFEISENCMEHDFEQKKRIHSNDTIHYYNQCKTCYSAKAIKKKEVIRFAGLKDFVVYENYSKEKLEGFTKANDLKHRHKLKYIESRRKKMNEYYATHTWKQKRLQRLKIDNFICLRCLGKATEVHHKNYDNFRQEKMEDLESLCHPCHEVRHNRKF
jgi:hypothetical protein